jgi:RNA polymerase sigma factor (sigma-70 family)
MTIRALPSEEGEEDLLFPSMHHMVTALYGRYQPRIRCYLLGKLAGQRASRDLADDLTQLTFIRLWKALQRGVCFQTEAQACHYLHAIAANLVRDQWRHVQACAEVPLPSFAPNAANDGAWWIVEPSAPDAQDARETLLVLTHLLSAMPDPDRTLLLAHAYGYPWEMIAAHCATSVSSVKSRLARARMALREQYAAAMQEPADDCSP